MLLGNHAFSDVNVISSLLMTLTSFHSSSDAWNNCVTGLAFMTARCLNSNNAGPDSANGRASASGAGGRGFYTWPRHTKGVKNGTSGYLTWRSAL